MDILIFSIGFSIFVTYMFFLLRMINRSHKSQEKAQNKYKRQINPINTRKNKKIVGKKIVGRKITEWREEWDL